MVFSVPTKIVDNPDTPEGKKYEEIKGWRGKTKPFIYGKLFEFSSNLGDVDLEKLASLTPESYINDRLFDLDGIKWVEVVMKVDGIEAEFSVITVNKGECRVECKCSERERDLIINNFTALLKDKLNIDLIITNMKIASYSVMGKFDAQPDLNRLLQQSKSNMVWMGGTVLHREEYGTTVWFFIDHDGSFCAHMVDSIEQFLFEAGRASVAVEKCAQPVGIMSNLRAMFARRV